MANNSNNGSGLGALLTGVSIFAFSTYWPDLFGVTPGTYDFMLSGFGQFIGFVAGAHGFVQLSKTAQAKERRKALEQTSGVFGTADFASEAEIAAKGLRDLNGLYLGLNQGQPIFYSGDGHVSTVAPARTGKGTTTATSNCLHNTGSMLITDPKGELAAMTGEHREKRFGHSVIYWNGYGLHGLPQHRINPLQGIINCALNRRQRRSLLGKVRRMALQLYPEPEDSRNRIFRDGSRNLISFSILWNALTDPENCTLPEIWRDLSSIRRLSKKLSEAMDSDELGGVVADIAEDITHQLTDNAELFGDFRTGAIQQLAIFEPSGLLAESVSGSDVDLETLKDGNTTIYLMMPQDRMASEGAALGLIVNEAIAEISQSQKRGKVLFLLDEFANLGRLSGLAESLTALPGLGVRLWMIVQEEAELVRLYGPNTAQTIKSQSEVRQYFAVNNTGLAQSLSKEMGTRTVRTRSHNLGHAVTDDVGENIGEAGQPLMRPEEIMQMGPSDQLVLVNGMRPIFGQRIPFWHVDPWNGWANTNPVEGDTPQAETLLRLRYTLEDED